METKEEKYHSHGKQEKNMCPLDSVKCNYYDIK